MQLYEYKKDCCGCTACMNICQISAIQMISDEYGFAYPRIEADKCIECGFCVKACPLKNKENLVDPIFTKVAVTSHTDVLQSASGGAFASFAKSFINDGGIVYGCSMEVMEGKLTPRHIGVEDMEGLLKLYGSKYVQSQMGNIYHAVRQKLNTGRLVLFSGTPCQVDGLHHFLKKDYNNLLTIDIICHGTPGIKLFQDYITVLERRLGGKVVDFKFRDKTYGWGYTGKVSYEKHGRIKSKRIFDKESSYYTLFLKSYIYRDSCYYCKYAGKKRASDITIGDYWDIEKVHPELVECGKVDPQRGVSCLLVNTNKGKEFLVKYRQGFLLFDSSFEKAATGNEQLCKPTKMDNNRDLVFNIYKTEGYDGIERWYRKQQGLKEYFRRIKRRIPKRIRAQLKKKLMHFKNIK